MRIFLFVILFIPLIANGQSYIDQVFNWRQDHKRSLLTGSRPLKPADTAFLRFYPTDQDYCVKARFVAVSGAKPVVLQNRNGGAPKAVREYGCAYFELMGATLKLHIYRFVNMENVPQGNDRLFIPFADATNSRETFQGGRYLDILLSDIKDNKITLDFNKAYSPPAAYEKGSSYIVPPAANKLHIEIKAGERLFGDDPDSKY